MIRTLLAIAAIALPFAAPALAQEPRRFADTPIYSIEHDGGRRTFGLYAPPNLPAGPAPLIIALHGRFSSAKAFHALSGLAAVADARGAIVAYPETLGLFWNDGGHAALGRREAPADDAGFIVAMVDAIASEYAIDRERIYVVGYDIGGGLAYRLACGGPVRLAGVAVAGALMWEYARDACAAGARPTPVLILHGRRDGSFPSAGDREPIAPLTVRRLGAADTVAAWSGVNRCTGVASATSRGESALYTACAAPVAYVGIERGGHDWFRARAGQRLNRHGVDAARAIDGFFFDQVRFTLPAERVTGDRARSYFVYVPPNYDPARPMPIVVLLHGRPSNAAAMAQMTQMNAVAARRGFIVVYPEGVNNEWNSVGDLIGARAEFPQDDVRFLGDLVDELALDLNIDLSRQYIGGYSNGGFMTLRMACSASERFAAFASVGAALYNAVRDECRGKPPAPVLIMHGSADRSIHYEGVVQPIGPGGEFQRVSLSVPDTVQFFINHNRCSDTAERTNFAETGQSPGTNVIRFEQAGCEARGAVSFYLINGGGHVWPGVPYPGRDVNMDINAGEAIWDFFNRHPLRD